MKKKFTILLGTLSVLLFTGCGSFSIPFILGATGVGVATKVIVDQRSVGAQVDDSAIDDRLSKLLAKQIPETRISVTSYNRVVLLTGQVPNQALRAKAESIAKSHENVRGVFNYLAIAENAGIGTRTADTFTTSKVKSTILATENIKARDVKVVTESSVVYLLGIVTAEDAEIARRTITKNVSGISRMVTLFEIQTN